MDVRVSMLSDDNLVRLLDLLREAVHLAPLVEDADPLPLVELAALCAAEQAIRKHKRRERCGTPLRAQSSLDSSARDSSVSDLFRSTIVGKPSRC